MEEYTVQPIAFAANKRKTTDDDHWGSVETTLTLVDLYASEVLHGLEEFSHVEVVFVFHLQDPGQVVTGSEHPRENPNWPKVGIFSQRKKARPNRIGVTVAEIVRLQGRSLVVRGFDGIDGTPILDIKPVLREFLPRRQVQQPEWATELMKHYW